MQHRNSTVVQRKNSLNSPYDTKQHWDTKQGYMQFVEIRHFQSKSSHLKLFQMFWII